MKRLRLRWWLTGASLLGVLASIWLAVGAWHLREMKRWLVACEADSATCGDPVSAELHGQLALADRYWWFYRGELAELRARDWRRLADREVDLKARRAQLKRALRHAERAVALRPRHAFAHLEVLISKFQLGDFDQTFVAAFEQSLRLGAHERRVLLNTVEAGFALRLAGISPPPAFTPAVAEFATREPGRLIELAIRYDQGDYICRTPGVLRSATICSARPEP